VTSAHKIMLTCDTKRASDLNERYGIRGWGQMFPAWHTKAAPNGQHSEGYIAPSMVRLMCQYQ